MAVVLKARRFTADKYHRISAAGILSEDDRVELLAGEIVDMSPIGPLQAGTLSAGNTGTASSPHPTPCAAGRLGWG
jgi:hypothetical protein